MKLIKTLPITDKDAQQGYSWPIIFTTNIVTSEVMKQVQQQKIIEIFSQMFFVSVDKIDVNKKIIDQFPDLDSLDIAEVIVDIEDKLDLNLSTFEDKFSIEERIEMTIQEFIDNVIKEGIKG